MHITLGCRPVTMSPCLCFQLSPFFPPGRAFQRMKTAWCTTTLFLVVSSIVSGVRGERWVNYTIDDQLGDENTGRLVTYTPSGVWSQGSGCNYCALKPDNGSAFDGTWHDGTHIPDRDVEPLAFEFKFNGTAFYIFNILVKLALTDVNVTLDGELLGRYTRTPNITDGFLYNASIFSKDDIPYGEHTVGVSAFGPNQTNVLFDYAIYTTNVTDESPSTQPSSGAGGASSSASGSAPHSRNLAGPVAGGVVGGVVLIAAIILGLWWYRRRDRRKAASVSPFINKSRQPFDGMLVVASEDKDAGIAQAYVPTALKSEDETSDFSPSTARSNDIPFSSSPSQVDEALHADVQVLREELASLVRSSQATPISGTPAASTYYSSPSRTTGSKLSREHASSIENEIRSLRQEVQQLRAQQEVQHVSQSPPSISASPAGGVSLNLVQEIASLRSEMEELRMQQEILAGPLPDYSPPEGPLPGFTHVGVVEQPQEVAYSQNHPHHDPSFHG